MPQPHIAVLLTPEHAEAYRALMLNAYTQHPEAFTTSTEERASLPLSFWQKRLENGGQEGAAETVFGCFVDGQLAGVAGLSVEARLKARHKATLFGMYVGPSYRQLGLGQALVAAVLAHATSRPSLRLVQLTVTDGNTAAIALYQRHGFVPFGLEPLAVAVASADNGFVAKVHMWCDLRSPTPQP
jgi:ribosomal protein S18 acetylase RimI-like enzyme